MEVDLKIINCYIVTLDENDSLYENGCIIINNGKIYDIGDYSISSNYSAKELVDAMGGVVMPGLVNAHNHAAMTIYRGMADDLPLHEWLNDHILPVEAKHTNKDTVRIGSQLAVMEMLRSGTTTFADMYYFEGEIAKVCEEIGIRAFLGQAIIDFPAPDFKTPKETLKNTESLMEMYANNHLVKIIPAPHSIYTCSDTTIKDARAIANKYELPLQIHLSETIIEYDSSISQNNCTPVQKLEKIGGFDGATIAAHCVYISEEDLMLIKKHNVAAVNNPQSNLKLVSGISPVPKLLENGITVALGTDGVASNNNLDMFEEMKTSALIHKMNNNSPTVMDAKSVLKMATVGGAKALGIDSEIGTLEVGKNADMIVININQPHLVPLYNIYSQLVYAVKGNDVEMVIIAGKIILSDNQIKSVDELQTMIEAQQIANKIIDQN